MASPRVAVIGAGLSGVACAQALQERGIAVEIFERGRAPGGRLASPTLHGRRVDMGAAYFTAKDPGFSAVADEWVSRGLAGPWTDTFDVISANGHDVTVGPVRFAAPGGLRSLVRDLLTEDVVRLESTVDSLDDLTHDAVVLAMPDPQAARLAPDACEWVDYEPVIAVAAGWPERNWSFVDAVFVNDDPDVSFVADDGARRGDGAAVLVVHTTAERARMHLDRPDDAVVPVLSALRALNIVAEPSWTRAHRWTFAKPTGTHGDAEIRPADLRAPAGHLRGRLVSLRCAARRVGMAFGSAIGRCARGHAELGSAAAAAPRAVENLVPLTPGPPLLAIVERAPARHTGLDLGVLARGSVSHQHTQGWLRS